MANFNNNKSNCVSCRVQDGLVAIEGRGRGYYSYQNGTRMLVLERNADQRIRIDGILEIVVLELGNGSVRLGIDYLKDA